MIQFYLRSLLVPEFLLRDCCESIRDTPCPTFNSRDKPLNKLNLFGKRSDIAREISLAPKKRSRSDEGMEMLKERPAKERWRMREGKSPVVGAKENCREG